MPTGKCILSPKKSRRRRLLYVLLSLSPFCVRGYCVIVTAYRLMKLMIMLT